MPQTRFVTRKALELGLVPVVVINKVDRADARPAAVHDEVLELFLDLEAADTQLDAPFLYASARDGYAMRAWDESSARPPVRPSADQERASRGTGEPPMPDLTPLFETIVQTVPAPTSDSTGPFQMLVSTLDYSPYMGRVAIGRIERGTVRVGQEVVLLPLGAPGLVPDGQSESARVAKLFGFDGLQRVEVERASAGDIVALAGLEGVEIGKTIADPERPERLRGISVEEPTISVDFMVNNSPFAGRAGKYVTTRQVRDRLYKELERNVALRVEDTELPDVLTVSGRGELHLAILMETMRREGFEFQVSRPRVITRVAEGGERLEPYEELVVDVPEDILGTVMETLGPRKASLIEMKHPGKGRVQMRFKIPARGLFGYRSEFLTETRGEGIMHHRFMEYGPWAGPLAGRRRGVMVADREGAAVAYALANLQERSTMFVSPGAPVYEGMVVGEHVRPGDLDVNVTREKKLTNMRTTASDGVIQLEPPREITLEFALEYIEDDELIEVTPQAIRLRKRALDQITRRKAARAARAVNGE